MMNSGLLPLWVASEEVLKKYLAMTFSHKGHTGSKLGPILHALLKKYEQDQTCEST
jgi:hypothetical protein